MIRPNSEGLTDFIPAERFEELLRRPPAPAGEVRDVLAKSAAKKRLELPEMAALLSVDEPSLLEELFATARDLKKEVYGNRIVLFAPLYVGNKCTNSCAYCGFRAENAKVDATHPLQRGAARRGAGPDRQGPQTPGDRLRRASRLLGRGDRPRR